MLDDQAALLAIGDCTNNNCMEGYHLIEKSNHLLKFVTHSSIYKTPNALEHGRKRGSR